MGNLAFLGSHKRQWRLGAAHRTDARDGVPRLQRCIPDRIVNKTNGITFRRWLQQANPGLTALLVDAVGPAVLDDADDAGGARALRRRCRRSTSGSPPIKRANKLALAAADAERSGVRLDPDALFDVQIKRIHEYKRQLLNILETVALYDAIRAQPMRDWMPRVKIFAGKAAPELSSRQADHQARSRRGAGHQQRPGAARRC